MPTLAELQDPDVRKATRKRVVEGARRIESQEIKINSGIRTSEELAQRIREGHKVPFSYATLLEDADEYA